MNILNIFFKSTCNLNQKVIYYYGNNADSSAAAMPLPQILKGVANQLTFEAYGFSEVIDIIFYFKEVHVMAKCEICGKGVSFGIKVSHSHHRSNRAWKPNVKRVKAIVNGTPKHIYVCSRCLRSGKVTRSV